jgi:hypothetical protein
MPVYRDQEVNGTRIHAAGRDSMCLWLLRTAITPCENAFPPKAATRFVLDANNPADPASTLSKCLQMGRELRVVPATPRVLNGSGIAVASWWSPPRWSF